MLLPDSRVIIKCDLHAFHSIYTLYINDSRYLTMLVHECQPLKDLVYDISDDRLWK